MRSFKILFFSLLLGSTLFASENAKVVYDLTTGDPVKIRKYLIKGINAVSEHYSADKKELDAIVVISGNAYKFFIEDLQNSPYSEEPEMKKLQAEFKPLLARLNEKKYVVFNMCRNGMKARNIKKETLYQFVNADAMKNVYLINAQNNGYAYIPIH